ncbi:DUF1272 domain-containing protein [Cytobacillus purgationiresistens]|uniref:DUF1272 domain-containing protein n=1 Tax=Cytobacillus purgationiresistens TaxID=863449 RepID=UPI0027D86D0D|nr:DUF1272 domain-containing protein [Cytobacillus purgationiresistens]
MGLEMRNQCEKCSRGMMDHSDAYICIHECTFCSSCTERMNSLCPNCGGELVRRPKAGKVIRS